MPTKKAVTGARQAKASGKAASTEAGAFVREEIDKVRAGKHGARSAKQAIAIGLSQARRAGVDLPPPKPSKAKPATRASARYAYAVGQGKRTPKRRPRVARAASEALKKEPRGTVSKAALSRQGKAAARQRSSADRSAAARRASRTKGAAGRANAARKAARTRARRG